MHNLRLWLAAVGWSTLMAAASLAQDWPQWGGTASRNNTPLGRNIPTDWNVGEFERRTGKWNDANARNIKWVVNLGSETYGTPVVADGRIYIGSNNGAGYLARYPRDVDLGCVLCFRESDGEFLWQYSSEKLPSGRVHDWPMQGIASTPMVEGNRLWFVNNRGEVVCVDAAGFYDEEDDGPLQGVRGRLFETIPKLTSETRWDEDEALLANRLLRAIARQVDVELPRNFRVVTESKSTHLIESRIKEERHLNLRVSFAMGVIQLSKAVVTDGVEGFEIVATVDSDLLADIDKGRLSLTLRMLFDQAGVELPAASKVHSIIPEKKWSIQAEINGVSQECQLEIEENRLVATRILPTTEKREADVVWTFDMMRELGVRQHNLANCSIAAWNDMLFVCTSNGVDNSHLNLPAVDAPSFIALDKATGRVLWTDNSPGANIMHGQWCSPTVAVLGGVPQVIFGGGDGWIYSFRADRFENGKPLLLWKFDTNPKDSKWELGGRGTRNNLIAFPVVHNGLVYVVVGQDPEHGDGDGHLWAIDPTKKLDGSDVSPELVMKIEGDQRELVPHRRVQALLRDRGEVAVANPDSAVVWHYEGIDRDDDGDIEFEERFHRSLSSVAVKEGLLFVSDLSGLVHCLDAKTGHVHWTCDLLAACWGSPLIVEDHVYIGNEDGDVAVFKLSADWTRSARETEVKNRDGTRTTFLEPLHEVNVGESIYSTLIVANNVLYVTYRSHLIAIAHPAEQKP